MQRAPHISGSPCPPRKGPADTGATRPARAAPPSLKASWMKTNRLGPGVCLGVHAEGGTDRCTKEGAWHCHHSRPHSDQNLTSSASPTAQEKPYLRPLQIALLRQTVKRHQTHGVTFMA